MTETDGGFEIFAVTADKGIRAWGADRSAVFRQAALGLWSLMVDPATVRPGAMIPVALEAEDPEALLVAWLNELLYLYDARRFIGTESVIRALTETQLSVEVQGEVVDTSRHVILSHVKAVTYHQVRVGPTSTGWEARVVVDV